jgi:protein-disulfide isomerase
MLATLLIAALLAAAPESPSGELTEERARQILPRADLSGLNDKQRAQFLEIAGDTFDYAGCNDTLAKCLAANVADQHALRMTGLIKALILSGFDSSAVIDNVERYYASFAPAKRVRLDDQDCPTLGDPHARVSVVEFSDYQCPHCARAAKPLQEMVTAMPGTVRLCAKYFPLTQIHPRAMIAAQVAEFARAHKKFWEMNELLFANQEQLDDASLKSYAAKLGLNGDQMLREAYAGKFDATIGRHVKEGEAAGIRATPSMYFNGRFLTLPTTREFLIFSAQDEDEWQQNHGAWAKQ